MTHQTTMAQIADAIDRVLRGPALVIGSPPPHGRDLDLLAETAEYAAVAEWLTDAGFIRWGRRWARFDESGAVGVDLVLADRWRVDDHDFNCLLERGIPLHGFRHLRRPDPATVLLLAARGLVGRRGRMTEKSHRRVAQALEEDPQAWTEAERLSSPRGMAGAMELLRRAHASGGQLSPASRARGLAGVWLCPGPVAAKSRLLAEATPRRWRPAVVSFSGLDGSGKSTQVHALQEHLGSLGLATEVQWAGFKSAWRLRAALPFLDLPTRPRAHGAEPQRRYREALVPRALEGHRFGLHCWVTAVVLANAVGLWCYVLMPRHGRELLIFDRFSPDSAVKIGLFYGVERQLDVRIESALFAALSPKPDVGFLVAVSSEVAHSRRQDQTTEELADMARLYEEGALSFGLVRLDGTEPTADLARRVARTVWEGMR